MSKSPSLIRWSYRYRVDVAAKVGLNQGVCVQIFPDFHNLSVLDFKDAPMRIEPISRWHQAPASRDAAVHFSFFHGPNQGNGGFAVV